MPRDRKKARGKKATRSLPVVGLQQIMVLLWQKRKHLPSADLADMPWPHTEDAE